MRKVLLATLLALPQGAGADTGAAHLPGWAMADLESWRESCALKDGGQLSGGDRAYHPVDLDGDGKLDWIFDEAAISCTSQPGFLCVSGGCGLVITVGDDRAGMPVDAWELIEGDEDGDLPVIRITTRGEHCGDVKYPSCLTDYQWRHGTLLEVASRPGNN